MPNHDRPLNWRTHEGTVVKLMYPPCVVREVTIASNPLPPPRPPVVTEAAFKESPEPGPRTPTPTVFTVKVNPEPFPSP